MKCHTEKKSKPESYFIILSIDFSLSPFAMFSQGVSAVGTSLILYLK